MDGNSTQSGSDVSNLCIPGEVLNYGGAPGRYWSVLSPLPQDFVNHRLRRYEGAEGIKVVKERGQVCSGKVNPTSPRCQ